jgi:hypothetical protein
MEGKHTPGPWHYAGLGEVFARGERKVICNTKMAYEEHLTDGDPVACANWDANARLIAAAPDLLAALEKIAFMTNSPDSPPDPTSVWIDLHGIAKAALAKAQGESNG